MIDIERLSASHMQWMRAVANDEPWGPVLDELSAAVGATGAVVMRPTDASTAAISSLSFDDIRREFLSGQTPPFPKNAWITRSGEIGFVAHGTSDRIRYLERLPFYRDYLVPIVGVAHRAAAILNGAYHKPVRLVFWRSPAQGQFEVSELEQMEQCLPSLRSAILFAKHKHDLLAHQKAKSYLEKGELVLFFDSSGKVPEEECDCINKLSPDFRTINRRLVVPIAAEQKAIDAAIANAVGGARKPASIAISSMGSAARIFMNIVPLPGETSEIVGRGLAMGVIVDPSRRVSVTSATFTRIRQAAGLTNREAEAACLLASGLTAEKIAIEIGIGIGTVRNQIKSAMQKFCVHSQVELVALVSRLG
jgi:DNA-binding CsgD family transcriptional regulator